MNTHDIEDLRQKFTYDSETGIIRWKFRCGSAAAGSEAGCVNSEGYVVIRLSGRQYRAHRIAWALHYGEWPEEDLDHVNMCKTDNRISNLRPCNDSLNNRNRPKKSNGRHSRYKGVDLHKGKWRARIRPGDGTRIELGHFATEEQAAEAYSEAAKKYHGEYARL